MAVAFHTRNAISGISVLAVDANTSAGSGALAVATTDSVSWQAPGSSTAGSAVTIANGEQKLLYDGDDATQWLLVGRTSATDLDTTETAVVIVVVGVTTAERLAQVDDAITACLEAQQTSQGGDQIIIAQLKELRDYRDVLARKLATENGTKDSMGVPNFRENF